MPEQGQYRVSTSSYIHVRFSHFSEYKILKGWDLGHFPMPVSNLVVQGCVYPCEILMYYKLVKIAEGQVSRCLFFQFLFSMVIFW
jgi:hypothetical protein